MGSGAITPRCFVFTEEPRGVPIPYFSPDIFAYLSPGIVLQNYVITKDRAYIIDREYSTQADRYLDLASFCTQNILASGGEEMFLKSYFRDSGREPDYKKLLLYKMSIGFMWIYWHLDRVAHDRDAAYNEYRWRMHLNNAIVCKEKWEAMRGRRDGGGRARLTILFLPATILTYGRKLHAGYSKDNLYTLDPRLHDHHHRQRHLHAGERHERFRHEPDGSGYLEVDVVVRHLPGNVHSAAAYYAHTVRRLS